MPHKLLQKQLRKHGLDSSKAPSQEEWRQFLKDLTHSLEKNAPDLTEMAGGIAHEINTPLATIQLLANTLHDAASAPVPLGKQEVLEMATKIELTVQRISRTIRGLRTFARKGESDSPTPVQVRDLLDETFEVIREKLVQHGIALIAPPVAPELSLECHRSQIAQVLLDLCSVSMEALSTVKEDQRWLEIGVEDLGASVEIRVIDGSTSRPKSTSLGLSISKGIIDQHHGHLAMESKTPNSCFVLTLPKTQKAGAA